MGVAKNRRGANMPNGLDTENRSMTTVPAPSTRQTDVAITIFFLAAKRSSSRPPLSWISFPAAVIFLVLVADELFRSIDLSMVRSRDRPHLKTASRTITHIHTKATQATSVAVCECLAADRIVPTKAPMHTTQRVACCPTGRSSAFDTAMISGVSCTSRESFLTNVSIGTQFVGSLVAGACFRDNMDGQAMSGSPRTDASFLLVRQHTNNVVA